MGNMIWCTSKMFLDYGRDVSRGGKTRDEKTRMRWCDGYAEPVRHVRGDGDARGIRAGGSQSLVHPGFCRRLRARLGLRISAGRLAVWAGRGDLGRRRAAALACQAAITSPLPLRQDAKPCRALDRCALRRVMKSVSTLDCAGFSVWMLTVSFRPTTARGSSVTPMSAATQPT